MSTITLISAGEKFEIPANPRQTIGDALRSANIPLTSVVLRNTLGHFVSHSDHPVNINSSVFAYCIRNADLSVIKPDYVLIRQSSPVAEAFRALHQPGRLGLVQFSRADLEREANAAFDTVMSHYLRSQGLNTALNPVKIQVSLSSGGDSRLLAECASIYASQNDNVEFDCITVALGVEAHPDRLEAAASNARRLGLSHSIIHQDDARQRLGYSRNLEDIRSRFREKFPSDEPEILDAFWVQEINKTEALRHGRRAVLFGYNQEDVVAERFFQLCIGRLLDPYPVRTSGDLAFIAPFHAIPKALIDAFDLENSRANYERRDPSDSYLRSSLYFLAYLVCEKFPALADVLSGSPLKPEDPDIIHEWLKIQ